MAATTALAAVSLFTVVCLEVIWGNYSYILIDGAGEGAHCFMHFYLLSILFSSAPFFINSIFLKNLHVTKLCFIKTQTFSKQSKIKYTTHKEKIRCNCSGWCAHSANKVLFIHSLIIRFSLCLFIYFLALAIYLEVIAIIIIIVIIIIRALHFLM